MDRTILKDLWSAGELPEAIAARAGYGSARVIEVAREMGLPVHIQQLDSTHCRWPLDTSPQTYCGRRAVERSPCYCQEHIRRATSRVSVAQADRIAEATIAEAATMEDIGSGFKTKVRQGRQSQAVIEARKRTITKINEANNRFTRQW